MTPPEYNQAVPVQGYSGSRGLDMGDVSVVPAAGDGKGFDKKMYKQQYKAEKHKFKEERKMTEKEMKKAKKLEKLEKEKFSATSKIDQKKWEIEAKEASAQEKAAQFQKAANVYSLELAEFQRLGFTDQKKCIKALTKSNGDFNAALKSLKK